MACFTAPLAEALVATAVKSAAGKPAAPAAAAGAKAK